MEEKQLDFNQPFLSVRRYSSTPSVPSESNQRRRTKADASVHKLPPLPYYKSELKSGPVRNPGKVPFVWERVPGKPKEEKEPQIQTAPECRVHAAPKLPPGINQRVEVESQDPAKDSTTRKVLEPVLKHESPEDGINVDGSGPCSEEGDEAFLDARDTFSRSDSFFMNCSLISSFNGSDGLDLKSPLRPDPDPMARDFMIGRFLPAAKAMASEAPQHAARKPSPLAREIPRLVKVSDRGVKEESLNVNGNKPKIPLRNVLDGFGGETDDDDDYDDYENSPAKVCGLLPSFCLLNPVPGIKNMPSPRPRSARRVPDKSSLRGSFPESTTKKSQLDRRSQSGKTTVEKHGKRLAGSDLYRRLQGNAQPHKPKEVSLQSASKPNPDPQGKRCMNFLELLASEGSEWESGSAGPVAEKTLYVDSVELVKSRDSTSTRSSDSNLLKNDTSCGEIKQSVLSNGEKLVDLSQVDTIKSSTDERDPTIEVEAKAKKCEEARNDAQFSADSAGREISLVKNNSNFHLPPPLPKCPTDSWLSKTLLTVSSKNLSSSQNPLGRKTIACKFPPIETKWETIIRTSNVHHGHLRFSEELLPPIPDA